MENLRSKFPDFYIQTDQADLIQELRGVFEEKAFTFRLGQGFAILEIEKRGHKLKISCDRTEESGIHWSHPMTIAWNNLCFYKFDLRPQTDSALQQQTCIAFKHGIEILERFHHFLQERLPEIYELCKRKKVLTDESFSVFSLEEDRR